MLFLKQSTAVTVKIGPFLDSTNGDTDETGLTLTQGDIRLSKNGGNMAQKNDASAATHDEIGWYDCDLDATDTNTLGHLVLMVHETGALAVWHEFMVIPANEYDSLISGTDALDVEVASMANNVITSAAINTGAISSTSFAAGAIQAAAIGSDAITAAKIATDAIDRDSIAADTGLKSLRSNTAQTGTATSITLDAGASAFNERYTGLIVKITGGTGNGQARLITAYDGTTKIATTTPAWDTNPDATSTFALLPQSYILGIAGTKNTLDDLNDITSANVNTEVVDALATDTYAEPGQGAPAATASLKDKISYLYKFAINQIVQDATTLEIYNNGGVVVDQKATISDDGTDYTRGQIGTGP